MEKNPTDVPGAKLLKKFMHQMGCSDSDAEQVIKETLDRQAAHPVWCKVKFWLSMLLFLAVLTIMIVAWKLGL